MLKRLGNETLKNITQNSTPHDHDLCDIALAAQRLR